MLPAVRRALQKMGYSVADEVRILGKTLDVVGARCPAPELVTIELKLADWRRALCQAYVNQAFAGSAFVALDEVFVHRADLESFRQLGVGLMQVGTEADVVLDPLPHDAANGLLASRLWLSVMEVT